MKKLRTIFDKGICCNLTRIFVVCVVFSLLFSQLSGIGLGIIIKVKGRLRSTAMFGKGCHYARLMVLYFDGTLYLSAS